MGSPYSNISTNKMLETFMAEFCKIERCSERKYNNLRSAGVPTWECVARRLGVVTWQQVCEIAGVISIRSMTNTLPIEVISYTETDKKLNEIDIKYGVMLNDIYKKR